ncbi:LysR family transcriptional regulator [Caballeronia sp. dw_19]|uniref:LysR family transcriptional regulator n=1 Tax=Caballeronia sp. dw_19 TaxID=2719791 RepID=UPI001BCB078F|nr:LysR family transcriptional regulator [Caballeronia sp. dw_19]
MGNRKLDTALVPGLWFFKVAAESGTFARAAEELCVTQSAVSQRVRALEDRLDTKLFERAGREVKLTASGLMLLGAVREGFAGLQTGLDRLPRDQTTTVLKVRCAPSLALEWLTPRLHDFMRQHPDVSVSIFADWTYTDRVQFERDAIDVAVGYGDPGIQGRQLLVSLPELVRPVCSPDIYGDLNGTLPSSAAVVLLHDVAPGVDAAPNVEWMHWTDARGAVSSRRTTDLHFNLAWLAYQAAIESRGVAIGRSLLVDRLLRERRLVFANDQPAPEASSYFVLAAIVPPPGSPIHRFVEWLTAELSASLDKARSLFLEYSH